jgi:riboflavin kinase
MIYENQDTLDLSKNLEQKRNQEKSEYLNLPDLDFFLWCQQQYKINKGVYNTIDRWFYKNGFMNIIHRRLYLLAFLEFVTEEDLKNDQHKYIKFGNGGLTKKLQEFIKETESKQFMI